MMDLRTLTDLFFNRPETFRCWVRQKKTALPKQLTPFCYVTPKKENIEVIHFSARSCKGKHFLDYRVQCYTFDICTGVVEKHQNHLPGKCTHLNYYDMKDKIIITI